MFLTITGSARITRPDIQMFRNKSWKQLTLIGNDIYFLVQRSRSYVSLQTERDNAAAAAYVSYSGFSLL